MKKQFKYIYGPVYSWRLGMSLGIDPISDEEKICNFDCVYCQLGKTEKLSNERKVFVETKDVIAEIENFPQIEIDYYTFSGRGEPTLAKNIGEMIAGLKEKGKKVAVITNSALIDREDVQQDLLLSDLILAKLDAFNQESFLKVSRPFEGIEFDCIIKGIKEFRGKYKGKLALQVMFVKENIESADLIAEIAKEIGFDEVQINTPLRPSEVDPLSEEEIKKIKNSFEGNKVKTVFDEKIKEYKPIDEKFTLLRHGDYKNTKNIEKMP